MSTPPGVHAEIVVDLAAIRHNVRVLRQVVSAGSTGDPCEVMVVVKANGYGHGMLPCARAAREAGATWLGVALLDEALALRGAGDEGRILSWLAVPGENYVQAIRHDIDVTAYSLEELDEIRAASRATGEVARVQLKVDTGLSRGGSPPALWPSLVAAAREAEEAGEIRVTGIWSHFACSDEPEHPANDLQEADFRAALVVAEAAGLTPEVRHLSNSAAALLRPSARFDLVRCGISAYGLDPAPEVSPEDVWGLIPAMTVRATLALTKHIDAGAGVSYGHTWVAQEPTTVGLVPIGYGEGVPRHASSRAEVLIEGVRRPVRGRICMDQFVVDLGGSEVSPGTEVVIMGPGHQGEPTAQDWAEACDTINYEIVTRLGGRMHRRYVDSPDTATDPSTESNGDATE